MYFVYILTNVSHKSLYVGVTNDLTRRLKEHKDRAADSFTKRYLIDQLVYYEAYSNPKDAIAREKQLKGWRRNKKDLLIGTKNPEWQDFSLMFLQK